MAGQTRKRPTCFDRGHHFDGTNRPTLLESIAEPTNVATNLVFREDEQSRTKTFDQLNTRDILDEKNTITIAKAIVVLLVHDISPCWSTLVSPLSF
jgi:hypothetical protein